MRVLLMAMPDTVSALDAVTRMPNLGLCSVAGNLEGCDVKVVDLVFHNRGLSGFIKNLIKEYQPDLVGLSAMTHQYASACRVSRICRQVKPGVKIALGGYHASLMYREIGESADKDLFDFLVRGEGEITFRQLVQELNGGNALSRVPGLSYRSDDQFYHNGPSALCDLDSLKLPDRDCRVLDKAQFLRQSFDCVETSRGCTMGCRFCSIGHMYGRSLRNFSLERVIADLKNLKAKGKKGVFFVDDNITLNVPRLKRLCELIVAEKLDTLEYIIQASVPGIASDRELPPLLKRAGFRWVFLGIENGISRNLESMGKAGILNNAQRAVSLLQEQGVGVFGGFIIGHPDDSRDDIRATFRFALDLGVDHPIMQCLTPYPKTETRNELAAGKLITNMDNFSLYNGFTCNIRTRHLTTRQINQAVFWNGLRLYFHPRYLARSRFWHYRLSSLPALLSNNFRYLSGALRGRIFISRHRW
ncbi:MAG: radical SAM protein [Dehalococcoidales bacterium]|nr:radical SAM protein [Dehalococcoidales bacterium]